MVSFILFAVVLLAFLAVVVFLKDNIAYVVGVGGFLAVILAIAHFCGHWPDLSQGTPQAIANPPAATTIAATQRPVSRPPPSGQAWSTRAPAKPPQAKRGRRPASSGPDEIDRVLSRYTAN